ncbi:MAG: PAS domain-containing protein [Tagaea sp.]
MTEPAWSREPEDAPFETAAGQPRLARLYAYWRACRPSDGALPGRRHIDPVEMVWALGNVWLLDLQRAPFRLRYRLIGSRITAHMDRDPTGEWLDVARPQVVADPGYYARYRWMAETRRATWRCGPPRLSHDPYWKTVENVMLPLAADGTNVDMFLCASAYRRHDGEIE